MKKEITLSSYDATTVMMYLESCDNNANWDDVSALISGAHYLVQRAWSGSELENHAEIMQQANDVIEKYETNPPTARYELPTTIV